MFIFFIMFIIYCLMPHIIQALFFFVKYPDAKHRNVPYGFGVTQL